MIVITGATGKLGHEVVQQLLTKVEGSQIVLAVRNVEKASDFASQGVEVRYADYDRPETLTSAFQGASKVLLISGNELGKRSAQHRNAVEAVRASGAGLLVYTSILGADRAGISLAAEHLATEELIRASGIPFVFLRNGWYIENYTDNLGPALTYGAISGSAGDGRIAAATRADYAAAAVAVLVGEGHAGRVYELAGDHTFSMAELAAEVAHQVGKPVVYHNLTPAQYQALLVNVGLPLPVAEMLVDADVHIQQGELNSDSRDLHALIGRATTPLAEGVRTALARSQAERNS